MEWTRGNGGSDIPRDASIDHNGTRGPRRSRRPSVRTRCGSVATARAFRIIERVARNPTTALVAAQCLIETMRLTNHLSYHDPMRGAKMQRPLVVIPP
eukprot:2003631-Lingulodinium_polyedra.AAC.1